MAIRKNNRGYREISEGKSIGFYKISEEVILAVRIKRLSGGHRTKGESWRTFRRIKG